MQLQQVNTKNAIGLSLLLVLSFFLTDCGGDSPNDSASAQDAAVAVGTGSANTTTTTTTTTTVASASSLAIHVGANGQLVDVNGNALQLRGVNVSGMEFVAVQGWNAADPFGGQTPNWSYIAGWGANAVRLPLNEASWLGLQCAKNPDSLGTLSNADPGGNYKATVQKAVADANAAGLFVILDLHWSAPNMNGVPLCPTMQNAMPAIDHALDFWTSIANTFKSNPAVIFELFNEPFPGSWDSSGGVSAAARIRDGGTSTRFMVNSTTISLNWTMVGMQQMLTTVRNTGATNVILIGNDSWTQQITDAVTYMPTDPLKQVGAAWHPYPIYDYGTPQVRCNNLPSCSTAAMSAAAAAVKAGYPVVATEFGDNIASSSGVNSPWSAILLPFADANGISYIGWTWNVWSGYTENVLTSDAAGTPTYGYGEYVKQHYLCRAGGAATCQ